MNNPSNETLKRVIRLMWKQTDYEKGTMLCMVSKELGLKVNFNDVTFSENDFYHQFPIGLKEIHCVSIDKEFLYILCNNETMHILSRQTKKHVLRDLEENHSLKNMFMLMIYSFLDRFHKRKKDEASDNAYNHSTNK